MEIQNNLYHKLKQIEEQHTTEIEKFYSKIKTIEETGSVLGTICVPELIGIQAQNTI